MKKTLITIATLATVGGCVPAPKPSASPTPAVAQDPACVAVHKVTTGELDVLDGTVSDGIGDLAATSESSAVRHHGVLLRGLAARWQESQGSQAATDLQTEVLKFDTDCVRLHLVKP